MLLQDGVGFAEHLSHLAKLIAMRFEEMPNPSRLPDHTTNLLDAGTSFIDGTDWRRIEGRLDDRSMAFQFPDTAVRMGGHKAERPSWLYWSGDYARKNFVK